MPLEPTAVDVAMRYLADYLHKGRERVGLADRAEKSALDVFINLYRTGGVLENLNRCAVVGADVRDLSTIDGPAFETGRPYIDRYYEYEGGRI